MREIGPVNDHRMVRCMIIVGIIGKYIVSGTTALETLRISACVVVASSCRFASFLLVTTLVTLLIVRKELHYVSSRVYGPILSHEEFDRISDDLGGLHTWVQLYKLL